MRQSLIAGNWKMNGTFQQSHALVSGILSQLSAVQSTAELLVLPPFPYLHAVQAIVRGSALKLGAQNLYPGVFGAFTGEVSGAMLQEVGCEYVLVGHSERRILLSESPHFVGEKFKAAVESHLKPILCVGETQKEREAGETASVIESQLAAVFEVAGVDAFREAVIAYEPVWAIGTGLAATPLAAEAVHVLIREIIQKNNVDLARTIRILYGGSMKPENAKSLLQMPNIDGGLIGGASLDPVQFMQIAATAIA